MVQGHKVRERLGLDSRSDCRPRALKSLLPLSKNPFSIKTVVFFSFWSESKKKGKARVVQMHKYFDSLVIQNKRTVF